MEKAAKVHQSANFFVDFLKITWWVLMVNATCQMICYVDELLSYHKQSPGYVGNYTIPIYNSVALGGMALAGTIYIAQQLLRGATLSSTPDGNQSFGKKIYRSCLPITASIVKWTALSIGVGARVVGLMDNISMFPPGGPPSDYYPVWTITWDFTHRCYSACGGQ